VLASLEVTGLDAVSKLDLLLRGQERHFVDLVEIGLQAAFVGNGSSPLGSAARVMRAQDDESDGWEAVLDATQPGLVA